MANINRLFWCWHYHRLKLIRLFRVQAGKAWVVLKADRNLHYLLVAVLLDPRVAEEGKNFLKRKLAHLRLQHLYIA